MGMLLFDLYIPGAHSRHLHVHVYLFNTAIPYLLLQSSHFCYVEKWYTS